MRRFMSKLFIVFGVLAVPTVALAATELACACGSSCPCGDGCPCGH
jgi:hypothetical protein